MTIFYTIKGRTDGFGAQYNAILSGIAYCHYKKFVYVHSPITQLEHDVDVKKANEFIGIPINLHPYTHKSTYEPIVHWSKRPSLYYTTDVLNYIRKCYYSTPKPSVDIDIAIHIRRGDVTRQQHTERYTDNVYYIKIIKKLKQLYPTYKITIFSEGKYEDFYNLGLEESCYQLNTNVFETFHSLVCAKVLIQSYSSFSYCAGLLNQNIVYHYDTFWHKKLDHWLKVSVLN